MNNINEKSSYLDKEFSIGKQWEYLTPLNVEDMSDVKKMAYIRSQKRLNRSKACKFFGSALNIDVPIKIIEQFKLPALLESDLPLAYFLCFLIRHQNAENLFFLLEVTKYNETQFESIEQQRQFGLKIFSRYMAEGQPLQINSNSKIIEEAREKLKESRDLDDVFEDAFSDIYSVLLGVYVNFECSSYFGLMVADLNGLDPSASASSRDNLTIIQARTSAVSNRTSIYPLKAGYAVIDQLVFALSESEKSVQNDIASGKKMPISRHKLLERLVANFCEQRLGLEWRDNTIKLRSSLFIDSDVLNDPSPDLVYNAHRSSVLSTSSNVSALSNVSQPNASASSSSKRKDELDLF